MNLVLPIKITELGENDFYFEYPNNDMELYGAAESLSKALVFAKESLEFTLSDMFDVGEEIPVFDAWEYKQLTRQSKDNECYSLVSVDLKGKLLPNG